MYNPSHRACDWTGNWYHERVSCNDRISSVDRSCVNLDIANEYMLGFISLILLFISCYFVFFSKQYGLLQLLLLLSRFSRVRLCDPKDGSPPGSPIPGIL